MARRREFSSKVKAEIKDRAKNALGVICCEGCGLVLGKKPYQIDHTIAEELIVDKSRKLTAKEGKLLGLECCHKPKTAQQDQPAISQAKRREAKDSGFAKQPSGKLRGPGFSKAPKPPVAHKQALPPKVLFRLWRPGELARAGKGED